MNIDQVTLSILVNNLHWITEEMNVYLTKAAYSTNIKVRKDCSCAIYTRDGDMVAQGEFIPVHLGVMSQTLKEVLKIHPCETLKDKDVIIHNDPYLMGSHLWDVMLFQPVFYNGELVAFVGNLAHHVNIGGSTLERCLPTIFEEGLRFPPIKIYEQGVPQQAVFKIIETNVRTPYEVKGDMAAQTAANYRGVQRLTELIKKFGKDELLEYFQAILQYSEKGMREAIKNVPDGEMEFEDYVESDGIESGLFKIKVKVMIKDDELFFDFAGSSKPGKGGINSPWSLTHSATFYAVKSVLGSTIPTNSGAYRPIHLIRPKEESMLDARFPHAVGSCTCTPAQRIVDVIIGAFSKIVPKQTCACDGHWCSASFVGPDPRTGRYSAYTEAYGCGRGAKHNDDGADAHQSHLTNTANAPIEIIELEHPLTVETYALVEDSGGPGKFRGGVGLTRVITAEAETSSTAQSNRMKIGPYGLYGGVKGKTDYCFVELSNGGRVSTSQNVKKGDRVIVRTSGGGGWGNPLERDPRQVEDDVLNGYVSIKTARDIYKVSINPKTFKLNEKKTAALRQA